MTFIAIAIIEPTSPGWGFFMHDSRCIRALADLPAKLLKVLA
jgi:hypothetical protein